MSDQTGPSELEIRKVRLEERRHRAEIAKWLIIAVGAAVSFAVIDVGRLRLEQFRVRAENDRELLAAYLTATESPQPDVWKRKLNILGTFSDDQRIRNWADGELKFIDEFAALDALYRETLKVASELVARRDLADAQRQAARIRYEQLYWADLPFAGESGAVIGAMVIFRNKLLEVEAAPQEESNWIDLNIALIQLSKALRESHKELAQNLAANTKVDGPTQNGPLR